MVNKYVKKPVQIEAVQFTGDNREEVEKFCGGDCTCDSSEMVIHTLEGDMKVSNGDYVIKGIQGEFYPCKPSIFEDSYSPSEEIADHLTEDYLYAKVKDVKYTVLEDKKTTIANVYLENGFTIRGESSCVDPKNFNAKIGEEIAYENAFEKLWELEGYLLTEKIYKSKKH